jgi:DNA-binding NarL/FixJ family response regulator
MDQEDELSVSGSDEKSFAVALVDDDAMVRGWTRLVLEQNGFRVVGEASTGAEAAGVLERRRPDVVLLDYRLPDMVGTECLRGLRHLGVAIPVVLMTAVSEQGLNETAKEAGAQGSVLKTGRAEELVSTLRLVLAGEPTFDLRHPPRAAGRSHLSPREREVLRLIASGATNNEVGVALGVSAETVKTLVARTFGKLGVRRRAEAVSAAHLLGLLGR